MSKIKAQGVLIYIPSVDDNGQTAAECEFEEPIILGDQEHVLLVDDETPIVEAVSAILESLNYRVTSFNSSKRALQRFLSSPKDFDVLLTDLTMPELSGLDLIREIRVVDSEIKIILCSGLSSNGGYIKNVHECGYLIKPVTRRGYSEALAKVLKKGT